MKVHTNRHMKWLEDVFVSVLLHLMIDLESVFTWFSGTFTLGAFYGLKIDVNVNYKPENSNDSINNMT